MVATLLGSCSYDQGEELSINDNTLFEMSGTVSGFQYFKRTTDTLVSDGSSPHGSFVRIRFNETAANAMNSDLSALNSDRFPDGSLVVKEIYDAPGASLKVYAVMFKSSIDLNSGGGWIWAEYGSGGDVIYSAASKGNACTACHSAPGHVDFVRTFALH
jgi:hypothetical protein